MGPCASLAITRNCYCHTSRQILSPNRGPHPMSFCCFDGHQWPAAEPSWRPDFPCWQPPAKSHNASAVLRGTVTLASYLAQSSSPLCGSLHHFRCSETIDVRVIRQRLSDFFRNYPSDRPEAPPYARRTPTEVKAAGVYLNAQLSLMFYNGCIEIPSAFFSNLSSFLQSRACNELLWLFCSI